LLIVNLYPVAAGGGLQNAYSFLSELKNTPLKLKTIVVLRMNSQLIGFCDKHSIKYVTFSSGFFGRFCFEFFYFRNSISQFNPKLIFTLFGNPPLNRPNVPTISGFARSNIIESDVDFWAHLSFKKKLLNKIRDRLILKLVSKSDIVVLETQRLLQLAENKEIFGKAQLKLIQMSPSSLVVNKLEKLPIHSSIPIKKSDAFKVLYLSGSHPNKNIHKLAPLIKAVQLKGYNLKLITTMPESDYLNSVRDEFEALSICDCLENIGPISSNEVPEAIRDCVALINVSNLESFSNNWVEAWASSRLLIAKDAGYAIDSCSNAALYISFDSPYKSAVDLIHVLENESLYKKYVIKGKEQLSILPNSEVKFNHYVQIFKEYL
jgi:glycosyltransferase involved in cell wall biosynthesis